jgi:DNA-binding NtrC family response regulator
MLDAAVLVLENQHASSGTGLQIKSVLEREKLASVRIASHPRLGGPAPDLIIPILPPLPSDADQALAEACSCEFLAPMLPVVTAEVLSHICSRLGRFCRDFLVAPLREAELCARARQWLAPRFHSGLGEGAVPAGLSGLDRLVGQDPAFLPVKQKLPLMARSDYPVLLSGETGTGKEVCARSLHYLSRRAGKPFLPINCGAIPNELFESEFFGHERGAFTNAHSRRHGLIAEAEGGTLFLDEIEALSLAGQVKLLRFLQDSSYYMVGCSRPMQADVRIIASTNVELKDQTKAGQFREDLFYRIAILVLDIPPLRDRQSDIARLAAHFLRKYSSEPDRRPMRWSQEALEAMRNYSWPGNVRELENAVRRALVFAEGNTISATNMPFAAPRQADVPPRPASLREAKARAIEDCEKAYVTELLTLNGGNVTRAARDAQKERRAFGRLMKKYHIAAG